MHERVQAVAADLIEDLSVRLGERGYGGAWIVASDLGDIVHVGVTDGEPASRTVVLEAAQRYGIADQVTADVVRYPFARLEGFHSQLAALIGTDPLDGLIGFGVRADLNAVELILSSYTPELVARAATVIPEDALVITTIPGGKVVAG